jgi:hypothetical protein
MRKIILSFTLITAAFACVSCASGETIYLKNGRKVKGVLLRHSEGAVAMIVNGVPTIYRDDEIARLGNENVTSSETEFPGSDLSLSQALDRSQRYGLNIIPANDVDPALFEPVVMAASAVDEAITTSTGASVNFHQKIKIEERFSGYIQPPNKNNIAEVWYRLKDKELAIKKGQGIIAVLDSAKGGWLVVKVLADTPENRKELEKILAAKLGRIRKEEILVAYISSNAQGKSFPDRDVVVRFTLTNKSDLPVKIFKRWCSWGAYAWSFVVDAGGKKFRLTNPQMIWTRNYPASIEIASGQTQVEEFKIFDTDQWQWYEMVLNDAPGKENERILKDPAQKIRGRISLTGYFSLSRDKDDKYAKGAWSGSISSNTVEFAVEGK